MRGIRISLHFTFVLFLAFWAYQGFREAGMPGVWWSTAEILLIFGSVVLHELGHSFTAMHFGIGVRRILLMPIGGKAEVDSIPKTPSQELLITVAGPAVNFAIVASLWLFVDFPDGWDNAASAITGADVARLLLRDNLILGIFNLYPAFPMDGGRILRALLALRLPYLRATFWAVMVGRVLSVLGVVASIYLGNYVLTFAFVYIMMASTNEYRALKLRELQEAQWKEALRRHLDGQVVPQPPVLEL